MYDLSKECQTVFIYQRNIKHYMLILLRLRRDLHLEIVKT